MRTILAIACGLLIAASASNAGVAIPISGEVVRVEIVQRVENDARTIVAQKIEDRKKIAALVSFFREWSGWTTSTEKRKEDFPAGENYLGWIVFQKADGSNEIIGKKEKEMTRDGYRSQLSAADLKMVGDLTEMIFVPSITID